MILEMNKQDAAAWLEISAPTLDRHIKQGKVNVRRIPNAGVGKQSVVCLIEAPDAAPIPAPEPAVEPAPPQPTESPDAKFAREYREGTATDSFGNRILGTEKITALGPSPEVPKPQPIQDAAAKWDNHKMKHVPGYSSGCDAAGPLAGRPDGFSRSEQQKRREHDRAVIAASFPRRP